MCTRVGAPAMRAASNPTIAFTPDDSDWSSQSVTPDGFTVYGGRTAVDDADREMGRDNGGESDRWFASLTDEERDLIEQYTEQASDFNVHLRQKQPPTDADKALTRALDKFVLPRAIVAHRISTADLLGGASTVAQIKQMVGSVVTDRAFTSSALVDGQFEAYDDIVYHIKTPRGARAGAYVDGHSAYNGETEFLFNRGGCYRILGAYTGSDGMVNVNMEWIGRKTD